MRGGHWQPRRRAAGPGARRDSASHGREPPPAQHPCELPVRPPALALRGAPSLSLSAASSRGPVGPAGALRAAAARPSRDSALHQSASPAVVGSGKNSPSSPPSPSCSVAPLPARGSVHDAPRRRPPARLENTAHIPPTAEDTNTSSAYNRLIPTSFASIRFPLVPPSPPTHPAGLSLSPFRIKRRRTLPPEGVSRRQVVPPPHPPRQAHPRQDHQRLPSPPPPPLEPWC